MSSFAGIRPVVADLDGTLLNDEGQLNAGIVDMIKELVKREIMLILAGGYNIHIMKPYPKELPLQFPPIANDGANMFQGDACIYEKNMELMELVFASQQLQQQDIPYIAYTSDVVFTTSSQDVRLQFSLNRLHGKATVKQVGNGRDMLEHVTFKVIMVARNTNVMGPVLHTISTHCESLHTVHGEDDVYMIMHIDATKGRTLVRLMELL